MKVMMFAGAGVGLVVCGLLVSGVGFLSPSEAQSVRGGYENSRCLVVGDCAAGNYFRLFHCGGWQGGCTLCAHGTTPIEGCVGGYPGEECDYSSTAFSDCGVMLQGLCNSGVCVNLGYEVGECTDFPRCSAG